MEKCARFSTYTCFTAHILSSSSLRSLRHLGLSNGLDFSVSILFTLQPIHMMLPFPSTNISFSLPFPKSFASVPLCLSSNQKSHHTHMPLVRTLNTESIKLASVCCWYCCDTAYLLLRWLTACPPTTNRPTTSPLAPLHTTGNFSFLCCHVMLCTFFLPTFCAIMYFLCLLLLSVWCLNIV